MFSTPDRYIEVAGGDHVTIAWKNLPAVFEFFERKRSGEREK